MVRILGIDPGTQVVGYGVLEVTIGSAPWQHGSAPLAMRGTNVVHAGGGSSDVRLVAAGVLRLGTRATELPERLCALAIQFRLLLAAQGPTELALEQAFQGKSVQAALRIGEARGVVLAEAAAARVAVHQFSPARVKRCVTGNGAAAKDVVAGMVQQLVRRAGQALVAGLPRDATDAVAVAWTRLEERRSPLAQAAR